jgi:hypothetical protein
VDRIVIIDNTETERVDSLRRAFEAADCKVIRLQKAKGRVLVTPSDQGVPDRALAVLRHAGEVGEWPQIAAPVIYYSGDDPRTDSRIPAGAEYIYRQISSTWGAPSAEEARELIDYLRQVAKGGSPEKPSLLQMVSPTHLLISLAVLCQGYLFLHGVGEAADPNLFSPEEKKNGAIGCLTERTYRHFLPPDLPNKLGTVKKPAWWRRPFSVDFYGEPGDKRQGTENLIRKVQAEWERLTIKTAKPKATLSADWQQAWKNLQDLLNCFKIDDDITPRTVARAYCALVDVLDAGEADSASVATEAH